MSGRFLGYNEAMTLDPHLEEYIRLCHRIYERMKREGSWPWPEDDDEPTSDTAEGAQLSDDLIQ